MTDNVVQSFCERCGSRFTQTVAVDKPVPATGVLGRFRRRTVESESTPVDSAALPISEVFRDTFHFCLGCRRYNCHACWNEQEGHCLSCRPVASPPGVAPADPDALGSAWATRPGDGPREAAETSAWPTDDLVRGGSDATTTGGSLTAAGGSAGTTDITRSGWVARPADPPGGIPAVDARAAHPVAGNVPPAGSPAASAPDSGPDLPWTPTAEPDPWRGVVFSAEDRGRSQPAPTPVSVAFPAPPAPPAPTEPAVIPTQVDDVSGLASLVDRQTPVDATGWVRASAVVMGRTSRSPDPALQEPAPPLEEPSVVEPPVEELPLDEPSVVEPPVVEPPVEEPPALQEPAPPLEEPSVEEPPAIQEPAPPVDAALAPLPDTEAWLDVARRGLDTAPASLDDELQASLDLGGDPAVADVPQAMDGLRAPAASLESTESTESPPPDTLPDLPTSLEAQPPTPLMAELPPAPVIIPDQAPVPTPSPAEPPPPAALGPSPEAPLKPAASPVPPPGLAVWVTPVDPGPFAQPYQAPAPQAVVFMPEASSPAPVGAPPAPPGRPPLPPAGPTPPLAAPPLPPAAPGLAPAGPPPTSLGAAPLPAMSVPASAPAGQVPLSRQAAASRACPSCSLPLSTKARFCRRCGAPQPS